MPEKELPPKTQQQVEWIWQSIKTWEDRVAELVKLAQEVKPGWSEADVAAYQKKVLTELGKLTSLIRGAKSQATTFREVNEIRRQEAKYRRIVVRTWPPPTVAREFLYLGVTLFGAGGLTFAYFGYKFTGNDWVVPVGLWSIGLVGIAGGIVRLMLDEGRKWRYFEQHFDIEKDLPMGDVLFPWAHHWAAWLRKKLGREK